MHKFHLNGSLERRRLLSKHGKGIFQVPIDHDRFETYEDWSTTSPEECEKAFTQNDHVDGMGKTIRKDCKKLGSIVKEVDYASKFSSNEIFK